MLRVSYISFKLFQMRATSAVSGQKLKSSVNIQYVIKCPWIFASASAPSAVLWRIRFRICIPSYLEKLYLQHSWIFIKKIFINRTRLFFRRYKFNIFALFRLGSIVALITVLFMFPVFFETLTSPQVVFVYITFTDFRRWRRKINQLRVKMISLSS